MTQVDELSNGVLVIDFDKESVLSITTPEEIVSNRKYDVWMKNRTYGDDCRIDLVLTRSEIENMMKILQGVLDKSAGVVKNGND